MSTVKSVGIFALGAGIGAFVMYKYLNGKLDKQLTEEIEAIKEFYENATLKSTVEAVKEKTEAAVKEVQEQTRRFHTAIEKQGYDSFFKNKVDEEPNFEEEDDDPAENQAPPDDPAEPQPPYLIDSMEYFRSNNEKSTLTYYESVDVLAEDDDILDNVQYIVGNEFRDHFGDEEEDVVYVRNEKMGTDYEIIRDHADPDTVQSLLGYEDESEE